MPSTGKIVYYSEPVGPGIRVDSGIREGTEVTIDYDPIMAKLIVHAPDRELAIAKMIDALNNYKILGVRTSKKFMIDVMSHPKFVEGITYTSFIADYMGDRDTEHVDHHELAIAAAAAAASSRNGSITAGGAGAQVAPTPWQAAGSWQIGDSIHG